MVSWNGLPALADLPNPPIEVLTDDPAVTTIAVTIVISVAAIAGAIVTIMITPARTHSDANAHRACAYPHALRARGH